MGSVAIVDGIISSARPELVSIKEAEVLTLQMYKDILAKTLTN